MDQVDQLRLFVSIAERGSLSAVARATALSPSTVTLGLRRLEEKVGARLVTRTTRRLSLTGEGERFLADCRRILADLDDAMAGIADRGPLKGEIRVTAPNDFGRTWLPQLIDGFLRDHPSVAVALTLTDAVSDLADGGFDLGLRVGQLADSRLVARLLIRSHRRVVAAPAYWDRAGRPQHPRDLARHNCLVLARPGAPQANWLFQEDGRSFSVRVGGDRSANDGGALRMWAVAGAGVVLKATFDVADDIAAGRLEAVLDDFAQPGGNLHAVHPAGRRPSRRVAAFIDYLADNI